MEAPNMSMQMNDSQGGRRRHDAGTGIVAEQVLAESTLRSSTVSLRSAGTELSQTGSREIQCRQKE